MASPFPPYDNTSTQEQTNDANNNPLASSQFTAHMMSPTQEPISLLVNLPLDMQIWDEFKGSIEEHFRIVEGKFDREFMVRKDRIQELFDCATTHSVDRLKEAFVHWNEDDKKRRADAFANFSKLSRGLLEKVVVVYTNRNGVDFDLSTEMAAEVNQYQDSCNQGFGSQPYMAQAVGPLQIGNASQQDHLQAVNLHHPQPLTTQSQYLAQGYGQSSTGQHKNASEGVGVEDRLLHALSAGSHVAPGHPVFTGPPQAPARGRPRKKPLPFQPAAPKVKQVRGGGMSKKNLTMSESEQAKVLSAYTPNPSMVQGQPQFMPPQPPKQQWQGHALENFSGPFNSGSQGVSQEAMYRDTLVDFPSQQPSQVLQPDHFPQMNTIQPIPRGSEPHFIFQPAQSVVASTPEQPAIPATTQYPVAPVATVAPKQPAPIAALQEPQLRPTVSMADVPILTHIVEYPKNSSLYYVLECPLCNRKFDSTQGMFTHLNQTDPQHSILLGPPEQKNFKRGVEVSGQIVVDADNEAVIAHNIRRHETLYPQRRINRSKKS